MRRDRSSSIHELLAAAALALITALGVVHAATAADTTPEEVKARFVFQLLKYVTWPEAVAPASAPFVVGVLGDGAFAATLTQVVGSEQAQGRAVEVRTLASAAEGTGIHLL